MKEKKSKLIKIESLHFPVTESKIRLLEGRLLSLEKYHTYLRSAYDQKIGPPLKNPEYNTSE